MEAKPMHGASNVSDVLDRIMDKGIVINTDRGFQLAGMALCGNGSRIVVSSIETHSGYADLLTASPPNPRDPVQRSGSAARASGSDHRSDHPHGLPHLRDGDR